MARAQWPQNENAFADSRLCPSCFTPITLSPCTGCGLDLRLPRLAEVLTLSQQVARLLAGRSALLDSIREEQSAIAQRHLLEERTAAERYDAITAALTATSPEAHPSAPSAEPAPLPRSQAVASDRSAVPGDDPVPARPQRGPLWHRFSMQFTILGVGVLLTSVGATVFLLWAYLVVGLEVRSLIIAGASAGVLALAWFLRRRGLVATGEGVGVVAIVLLLLDAWIVRANDAFGSAAVERLGYHGAAALVLAAILTGTRRVTGLRVVGYAAAILTPLGFAAVAAALVADRGTTRWWVAGAAALCLASGAARLLPRSRPAQALLVLSGVIGLSAPLAAPGALPDLRWHGALALLIAGLLWGAFTVALRAGHTDPRLRATSAAIAGGACAAAPALGALQELSTADAAWFAPTGAAAVATAAALVTLRIRRRPWRGAGADAATEQTGHAQPGPAGAVALAAAIAATTVTVVAALVGLVAGLLRIGAQLGAPGAGWQDGPDPLVVVIPGDAFAETGAVIAPLAMALALAALLFVTGRLHQGAAAPTAAVVWASLTAATTLPAAYALAADAIVAAGALVLGVRLGIGSGTGVGAGAGSVAVTAGSPHRRSMRTMLALAEGLAGALILCIAWSRTALWAPGVVLFLLLAIGGAVVCGRIWGAGTRVRASRIGVAAVTVCVAAAVVPSWAVVARVPLTAPWADPWVWSALAAAAGLAAVVALPRLGDLDTWAAAGPALLAAGSALVALVGAARLSDATAPGSWLAPLVLALIGIGGVARERRERLRACMAVLAPPAGALAVWHAVSPLLDRPERWVSVAALLLVLTGAGLLIRLPRGAAAAIAWHATTAAIAVVTVASTLATAQAWLVLLIVAPIPFLSASAAGDPLVSRSGWRQLAWGSPVLAMAALWTGLGRAGASTVEAYTLPAAATLAGIALLLALRRPGPVTAAGPSASGPGALSSRVEQSASAGRAALAWAAGGVAALPSAIASQDDGARAVLTACAGGIALTLPPWCASRWRGIPLRPVLIAAGGLAVCGSGIVRGVALAAQGDVTAEGWGLLALLAGLATAVLYDRVTAASAALAGALTAGALVLGALPAVVLPSVTTPSTAMLLVPVFASALLHVAAFVPRLRLLTMPAPRWTALGVLLALGMVATTVGGVDPFDVVTTTIGASLLAAGLLGARPPLAWAGAAAALVPSIAAAGHPVLRPVVLVGVAGLLLAGARWIPVSARSVPLRTIALAGAAAAAVGSAGVRALALALEPTLSLHDHWAVQEPWASISGSPAVWSAAALAGGLVAAVLLQRTGTVPAFLAPWVASCAVAVSALAPVVVGLRGTASTAVLFAPVAAFAVLRVAIALPRRGLWTHGLLGGTTGAAGALIGAAALSSGRIDPFDAVTATIGISLLAAGTLRLLRTTTRRSWPALGPGLAVLLVPSLLADADPAPWRLFTLGAVALAVMLAGIRFRLQAPFLMGATVLAVHGLVQLWPVVAHNYGRVWWWLWLAIAGIVLIAIAATYERQLRLAKKMIRSVAALR